MRQRDTQQKTVRMCCPKCGEVIETTTTETMVYCLRCRRWCREEEPPAPPSSQPAAKPVKKRNRCH